MQNNPTRCTWCSNDPLYIDYHDTEWGIPVHVDCILFEFLTLEGAQAGLSWITILRKRAQYRIHFHDWNMARISQMTDCELEIILLDPGVVRNRLKVYSVRKNARVAIEIVKEWGSLDCYLWNYVDFQTIVNHDVFLTESDISIIISKDLKKRGMSFIGPTIIYAFMQAVGIVDDHAVSCFRYGKNR